MMMALVLLPVILLAIAVPILYVIITWDHDVVRTYGALPAPNDLGTKEFRWRCWFSPMTRKGWRTDILRSPCPRITLQCPFALLSSDFAKLTTSLGFQRLNLEKLPFIFPQIAVSSLFLQLLGNSNFPASVQELQLKAVTICQVRPLDMRFRDDQAEDKQAPDLNCVMVLTEKRFLENKIEFSIQTDLFDDQGIVWQSVTWVSTPFEQKTLLVPLSASGMQMDEQVRNRASLNRLSKTFACTKRNLTEFEDVSVADIAGKSVQATPIMWMLGQVCAILQQQERLPALPLMCNCVLDEEVSTIPLDKSITVESWTNSDDEKSRIVKFDVAAGKMNVMNGLLRTVGWTYTEDSSDLSIPVRNENTNQ